MVVGGEVPPPKSKSKQEKQTYEETFSCCGRQRPDPRCGDSDGHHRRRHPPPTQPSGLLAVQGPERTVFRRRRVHLRQGQGRGEDLRLDQSRRRSTAAVRVKDLGTRPAPASIREMLSRLVRGHGPATVVQRRQIPYWQERGWTHQNNTYTGSYQTPYGAFSGQITEHRMGFDSCRCRCC